MSHNIFLTQTAIQDMQDTLDYIEYSLNNPEAAEKMHNLIVAKLKTLQDFPKRNAPVPDEILASCGIRFTNVNNYIIFYVIDEDNTAVTVLRILYNRRNWQHILRLEQY